MRNGLQFIIIIIFSTIVSSCSKSLNPEDYIKTIENEKKEVETMTRNGFSIEIRALPVEYFAAKQMLFDSAMHITEAIDVNKNTLSFILTIIAKKENSLLSKDGINSFHKNVMRNTFGRERDVFLLNGTDTTFASVVEYEKSWGYGDNDVFAITFSSKSVQIDNSRLIIREILPEIGTLNFPIKKLCKSAYSLKDRS